MNSLTRRDLCSALPALAILRGAFPASAFAQPPAAGQPVLSHSETFSFDKLPANRAPSGATITRPVLRGALPTGESIEVHETTLMPGQMPHPPHKHVHSELMFIREGTVEFQMEDKSGQIGPGGVAYAASNTMHGLKNVGSAPANYFVIAIGLEPAQG